MYLYLHDDLKKYFSADEPLFDQIMALRGETFRHQEGRITQRVTIGGKTYFIKQHHGVGWKEIFKNLLQCKLPVLGAKNEWQAIAKLHTLGVSVPAVVGYGQRGSNPATQQSFVLMEELTRVNSLETWCANWRQTPPDFSTKRKLIEHVAQIARIMHQHGINHRDFYLCHFLLDTEQQQTMFLIDLHRAQIRDKTPERWVIKDLAGLYFSSKDCGLTQRDLYRFMQFYRKKTLRDLVRTERDFWQKVRIRGEQLYRDHTKQ